MAEIKLKIASVVIGSSEGGGGGVAPYYADLPDKPSINGETLSGNMTSEDLGLASSEQSVPSGGTTGQVLAKKSNADNDVQWVNQESGGQGTTNYADLDNKPKINNVTLSGNKTAQQLGLQPTLESGTNIKTINNQSIVGSGNITIESGGTEVVANPEDPQPTSEILLSLRVGGADYAIPENGSDVVANPSGDATTPLNKIKIGETIYKTNNPFAGAVEATDAERLQALANISNQEAGYDSSEPPVFTGKMGYVVLQPETDNKTTFAAQIANKPNTIFEIRDVFDLGTDNGVSVNVTIPNNCTLKFNGGRLKNGRIDLNNCYIDSNGICFEKSVVFGTPNMQSNATTVANTTIYTRWFDFVSADDEFTDYATATRNPNPTDNIICFKQLQRIISNGKNVEFESNQYLQSTITTPTTDHGSAPNNGNSIFFLKDAKDVKINLNGTTLKLLKVTSVRMYAFLLVGSDIELHNGKVIGNAYGFDYPEYIYNGEASRFYGFGSLICQVGGNFTIHDIEVSQGLCDCVHLGASYYGGSVIMGSYNMYNCQIHDTGRNGLHLSSSEYGNLDNVTIYNISVGNADYDDPDPNNIYPYSPSAGIDIEFEDRYYVSESSYVDPIMNLSNLDIYNCRALTIGSSTQGSAIPTVKTFNLKNSNLKGSLQPSGIIGDKVSVESCYINGAVSLGSSSIMNDCTIELRSSSGSFHASNSLLNNCIIRDYTNDEQWNMLGEDSTKAIFNKCDIKVHSMNFGVSTFTDCTIESENNQINCKEIIFKGCTIKNYKIGGSSFQSPSVVHLINCDCEAISNIARTVFIYAENSSFRNTQLITIGLANFQQCCFEEFMYTISTGTTATTHFVMSGCNGTLLSASYKYLEIKNSNIIFKNTSTVPAFAQQDISVINSIISDDNDINIAATWKATIVAVNSCFNIAKNYNTTNFNLSKCIINSTQSNFTEIGFLGVAKQCLFTDSIPTHGDSSSRPAASDMPNTYAGFTYFDETLGMPLYLKVDVDTTDPDNPVYTKSWVKADGTLLS